jgi:hypothetical protein
MYELLVRRLRSFEYVSVTGRTPEVNFCAC